MILMATFGAWIKAQAGNVGGAGELAQLMIEKQARVNSREGIRRWLKGLEDVNQEWADRVYGDAWTHYRMVHGDEQPEPQRAAARDTGGDPPPVAQPAWLAAQPEPEDGPPDVQAMTDRAFREYLITQVYWLQDAVIALAEKLGVPMVPGAGSWDWQHLTGLAVTAASMEQAAEGDAG